jgi:hypothetical protein
VKTADNASSHLILTQFQLGEPTPLASFLLTVLTVYSERGQEETVETVVFQSGGLVSPS